ncbi:PDZ domain-containing protein [Myxococcota bacterium]|nr:PDZ domain-containing protein [Myxococcota bacterium]
MRGVPGRSSDTRSRRALAFGAVALGGLLLGAWLAWPEPPPPAPAKVKRARPMPPPPPRLPEPEPVEDSGTPLALPAPAEPDAVPSPHGPVTSLVDRLPSGTVTCQVEGGEVARFSAMVAPTSALMEALTATPGEGDLRVGLHQALPGELHRGRMVFEAPLAAGTVFLEGEVEGGGSFFEEKEISWSGDQGRCREALVLAPRFHVEVSGRVRGLLEGEVAAVSACRDAMTTTDGEGRFHLSTSAEQGPCRVMAWRRDGALRAYSDMVDLEIQRDTQVDDLLLTLPDDEIGGMGARIEAVEGGVLLVGVQRGGPGALAGLQNGEVVTAVNGQSLAGMSVDEAIATITGPVGSYAVMTVVGPDGQERDVELQRGWVE